MAVTRRRSGGALRGVSEFAARTPPSRERYVDLLRALAILLVVLGHWLAAVVYTEDGRLAGMNVLVVLGWTHPITWVFQVMPVFFLVGGFANAASWVSACRRGDDAPAWIRSRAERILRPTTAFLVLVVVAALIARAMGVDGDLVAEAAWISGIALWFLATYLGVAAATPLTYRLHLRYGLVVPAVMALGVAAVDLVHLGFGVPGVGWLNAALLWGGVHQLGYSWHDGRLRRNLRRNLRPGWLLAAGGGAALLALAVFGPYPVSMVSVPGEDVQNASPPSLALLALAVTQAGAVLLLHEAGGRWCQGRRRWITVVAVNAVVLSLYLWHMAAVVIAAVLLYGSGLFPEPPVTSPAWVALRPLWIAALAGVLILILLAVARWERPQGRLDSGQPDRQAPRPAGASGPTAALAVTAGVVAACVGLLVLTVDGLSPPAFAGVPVIGLGLVLTGWLLIRSTSHPR